MKARPIHASFDLGISPVSYGNIPLFNICDTFNASTSFGGSVWRRLNGFNGSFSIFCGGCYSGAIIIVIIVTIVAIAVFP